jgi:hypothetical protein
MPYSNSREILLLGQTTITTSGTSAVINASMGYAGLIAHVSCNTVSGTSPTLNVYLQNQVTDAAAADVAPGPPTGSVRFQDLIAFSQITTTGQVAFAFKNQGDIYSAASGATLQQDATLTTGTVNVGPIGPNWRIKWVVGGTSPSFGTVNVTALVVPEG